MTDIIKGRYFGVVFPTIRGRQVSLQLFLDENEYTQRLILSNFARGVPYEPEISRLFLEFLTEGDTVIDVGAHVGYYSLLASVLVGAPGKVIACEMSKANLLRLLYHCQINNASNISIVAGAVGDQCREVSFFVNLDNDGGHALWNVGNHPYNQNSAKQRQQEKVIMRTLDAITQEYEVAKIKLIKIDVEGAEPLVLKGGRNTIDRLKPPFVICEINEFGLQQMGYSQMSVRHFFYDLGYHSYVITDRLLPLLPNSNWQQGLFNVLFSIHTDLHKS
ncbi:MAG: FkbM family methyltransferase [Pseudanabaenaceae cyanobacterium SKYGB_i_bin29]|nr:FkbM family methyltransferase [Pseudanabaenaceae cyanobacterium SKYG29]MDW8420715.1 FkbM family methyltransferase [Pseudanabaenaceae cyanobacterium SKYGB_i_bin29]